MGSGLALVSAALFGTNGTARALGPEVNPAVVGAARLMLGALALTIAAVLFEGVSSLRATLVPPKARRWLLTAAFATALYQVTFFGAVARAGVALGTVVAIGSAPIFTGLLSSMTTGDRLTVRWGTATALAVIGCGLTRVPARSTPLAWSWRWSPGRLSPRTPWRQSACSRPAVGRSRSWP